MLRLVLMAGACLAPLAKPLLQRRLKRGKEDPARWREKLGEAQAPRPEGPLVWLHGVGVGEVLALRGLIARLSEHRPDLHFLVTSSARSSAQVFGRNLPARTQHHYLPLDFPGPVRAFLDHWRPDLAIWSDQEIWPRLVAESHRRGIPQALVAARITARSAKAKARFGAAYGDLYRLLDTRHAQDTGTAQHLRDLMGDSTPVTVSGSLKSGAAPLADDPSLRAMIDQSRPIWCAASAHPADMEIALTAQAKTPDRLLILAPRVLEDAEQAEAMCTRLGLRYCRRSAGDWPDAQTNVFIADSFGELGLWYRLADRALIGGSFDATEGHNPWEAVALDCAVLHGPRVANFESDFKALTDAHACQIVTDSQGLVQALADPGIPTLAAKAKTVQTTQAAQQTGLVQELLALLPDTDLT